MDTLIGKTLCHYRIVEKIGAGGMGVDRARDARLGRDVAVRARRIVFAGGEIEVRLQVKHRPQTEAT